MATLEAADRAAEDMVVAYETYNRIELNATQNEGMREYFRESIFNDLNSQMESGELTLEDMVLDVAEMEIAEDILDQLANDGANEAIDNGGQAALMNFITGEDD